MYFRLTFSVVMLFSFFSCNRDIKKDQIEFQNPLLEVSDSLIVAESLLLELDSLLVQKLNYQTNFYWNEDILLINNIEVGKILDGKFIYESEKLSFKEIENDSERLLSLLTRTLVFLKGQKIYRGFVKYKTNEVVFGYTKNATEVDIMRNLLVLEDGFDEVLFYEYIIVDEKRPLYLVKVNQEIGN